MKKRIKACCLLVTIISLLVFAVSSMFVIDKKFVEYERLNLKDMLNVTISQTKSLPTDMDLFAKNLSNQLLNENVSVTVIDRSGKVQGDSTAKVSMMNNQQDRLEIKQALKYGYGTDLRVSETTGDKMLYVAQTWGEDYVLRFAIPVYIINRLTINMIPLLVIIITFMYILISLYVGKFTTKVLKPFQDMFVYMKENLFKEKKNKLYVARYEELKPIVLCFEELLNETEKYITETQNKTFTIENIIKSMQEGLIMLDLDLNIISMNKQSKTFLYINRTDYKINHLYRNILFNETLNKLIETKKRQTIKIKENHYILRFSMNYVENSGYVILISDITELVRLENMRSEFTSNVTHELKTPLTSISGFSELISMGIITDHDQIVDYNKKILSESKRMINLVEDILKLSDIESGNIQSTEKFELRNIFSYAIEILEPSIREKSINIEIDGKLKMNACKDRIYELVFNLFGNAVKYNNQNGSVKVEIFQGNNNCGFSIQDTGIGIPANERVRIFEKFYRVDKARSRKAGGTGLGLSIVKHIVELYKGDIIVTSNDDGSTFIVTFPIEIMSN